MTTLTEIATEVFNALTEELEGVVKDVTVTRVTKGEYNAATGKYPQTTQIASGRGLAETDGNSTRSISTFAADFPFYTITGNETLWFVSEFEFPPKAADKFAVDGKTYEVKAVRDILANGELFRVLVV